MKLTRALIVSASVAVLASNVFSQPTEPRGLDTLGDDALYNELARRDLEGLLKYAFEKNSVEEKKQEAVRAGVALARLQNPSLTLNERRKLVAEFVNALPQLLPEMKDPATLWTNSILLNQHGVLTDQRLLEYFGPNPAIMARLQSVTDGLQKMLTKTKDRADAMANAAMNNWPAGRVAWEKFDQLATNAEYFRHIVAYPTALALDKASEDRAKILTDAIEYLSLLDNPDNPEQAAVKFNLGKLNLALATPESLKAAADSFKFVIENGKKEDVGSQYDARVGLALAAIGTKDAAAAQTAIKDFEDWVNTNKIVAGKPDLEAEFKGALGGLRYRILMAQAKPADADKVLNDLQLEVPALRGLILELMAANVKPDAPVKELNSLLLQSLRAKGEAEVTKPATATIDKPAVLRAIEASLELIKRKDKDNERVVQDTMYVIGFLYQKLDQKKEAATAFLDYVEKFKDKADDMERLNIALGNAIVLVGPLYKGDPTDMAIAALFDRTLDLAVGAPFNRIEFAFDRGRRMQAKGEFRDAIKMYALVKADDANFDTAQYLKMVAIRARLDKLQPDDKERPALLADLQKLADSVTQTLQAKLPTAKPEQAVIIRTQLAQTRLVAADVALVDQKDPKRALAVLENFEDAVKGLKNADQLLAQVLLIRVKSYVQSNQVEQGVQLIQKLAQERPREAMPMIFELMDKLDKQLTAAQASKRQDEVANHDRTRSELTPVLVSLIRQANIPELKKFEYQISIFDADQQRRAADLTEDPAKQKSRREAALKRFEELDSKQGFADYLKSIEPTDPGKDASQDKKDEFAKAKSRYDNIKRIGYDVSVKMGLARTNFALGNWDAARRPLALLFRDKVLGSGVTVKFDANGAPDVEDNPNYWEAVMMLIRSNVALNEGTDAMKGWLTELSMTWKSKLGGDRWGEEFKKLQSELGVKPVVETAPDTTAATGVEAK